MQKVFIEARCADSEASWNLAPSLNKPRTLAFFLSLAVSYSKPAKTSGSFHRKT